MSPIPVTAYDAMPTACIERLQRLLDAERLSVTLSGGGVESPLSINNEPLVLIHRDEIREAIRHIRAAVSDQRGSAE
jgi:hypothetical protein